LSTITLQQNPTPQFVERHIKVWQFVLSLLGFLGILVSIYVNIEKRDSSQDERIKNLETQYIKMDNKSDKILDKIETLMILTANKQDRK
jgi:hypothetical protein